MPAPAAAMTPPAAATTLMNVRLLSAMRKGSHRRAGASTCYASVVALVDVILGYDCNLACDYCTITPEMRRRSLTTRAVLEALDEGRARGYDAVSFTGGEPTIRADLLGLVKAARARGYGDIKVQSNGLIYAHASNVDKLVA